jgi:hypothetical protein
VGVSGYGYYFYSYVDGCSYRLGSLACSNLNIVQDYFSFEGVIKVSVTPKKKDGKEKK